MATKTKKRPTSPKAKGGLTSLSQAEAASLIGKPAVWLRDNAHLFLRNKDGTYDARDVVYATQTQFRVAKLKNSELEPVLQFCDDVSDFAVSSYGSAVRLLEGVEQSHGAAGLAAVGKHLLETIRERFEIVGDHEAETPEQIQQQAEEKISRLESVRASREYRLVLVCGYCNKYRFGRDWNTGPPPSGHATQETICPSCEKTPPQKRRA